MGNPMYFDISDRFSIKSIRYHKKDGRLIEAYYIKAKRKGAKWHRISDNEFRKKLGLASRKA